MTYSASHVANFMLDRAENEDRGLSQMKLLKLVYIGYGWVLALLDEPLFDEPILAWDHGPVVRSLYDEFKHYGKDSIEIKSVELDLDTLEITEPRIPADNEDAHIVLGKVWEIYKQFGAWQLRQKTHEPDTPWSQVYHERGRNSAIPDDLIKVHFTEKIRQYLAHAE